MKKLNSGVTILALFFSISAIGQIGQGSVMLGGSAGFNIQFEDPDNITSVSLFPDIGYYFTDHFAAGGQLGIGYTDYGNFSNTSFSIAPFVRYDFGPEGNLKFFVQAMAGYITSKSKSDTYENTNSGATFGGGPGIAIFLNDNVAIEGILEYTKLTGDFDTSDLGLLIGIQAYLSGN